MGKWIKIIAFVVLLMSVGTVNVYAYDVAALKPFNDLQEGDWSETSVYLLSSLGVIEGYSDGSFRPDEQLTREAFIKLLTSAHKLGAPAEPSLTLTDVTGDRWSYPYIQAAYSLGWLDHMVENGQFHPERAITREEVAAAAGRSLLAGLDEQERKAWLESGWLHEQAARGFADQAQFRPDTAPYAYYAMNRGIMEGDETGFRPGDELTRKEAAAIIHRLTDRLQSGQPVSVTGFYAIRSYSNMDKLAMVDHAVFGWSHLEYPGEGSASLNTAETEYRIPEGWKEALDTAGSHRISKDLMVFYNDGPMLAKFLQDERAVEAFYESALNVLSDPQYGFTGLLIDFEGLKGEESREPFVRFIQGLKDKLGSYSLKVAVPPTYYYSGYDLAEIGRISDAVMLMAYDYTDRSQRLPSAPLPLVNDTVRQALQSIPAEKLILGISKQANQWVSTSAGTEYYSPAVELVEERLKQPGTQVKLANPYYVKQLLYSDDRGSHELWYEDTDSIEAKIWLAKYYGLQGVSLWHMGNFTDRDWAMLEAATR